MKERIAELESQVAFQDNTIQALNEVVTSQQQQLDILKSEIKELQGRIDSLSESLVIPQSEEKPPPHY